MSSEHVKNYRKRLKSAGVYAFDSKCSICLNTYPICVFDFHHLDKTDKSFGLSVGGNTMSKEKYLIELKKCTMLCANCHRIIEHENPNIKYDKIELNEIKYWNKVNELNNKSFNLEKRNKLKEEKEIKLIIKESSYLKNNISRDELKKEIRINSFLSIGKKYNVSDNGIRKLCKVYGLPFKKKKILLYSDEDWKNI